MENCSIPVALLTSLFDISLSESGGLGFNQR